MRRRRLEPYLCYTRNMREYTSFKLYANNTNVSQVDPWWNSYAEQQCFCRMFRIGQQQDTFVTKFVVRNTVDEMLNDLQEKEERLHGSRDR
jgi:SNF2 family DNA or RNA helicase